MMQFGLMLRAQFPQGDDMQARFQEQLEQARLADALGFDSITKGMHYSSAPLQSLQQLPFLSRVMAEAPRLRINFGLILLSLHKPLDVAEQIATVDVMSGGKVIFGVALGYREVEFLAFGTTQKERVKRFEENLEAVRRLWTEDAVNMVARTSRCWAPRPRPSRCRSRIRRSGSAPTPIPRSAAPPGSATAGTSTHTTGSTRSCGRWASTGRRSTSRQAVSGGVPGAPRGVRGEVTQRGHPAQRAVPGRQVRGVSPVGPGQGDARGRQ
jgi:alkanesulfonate monooxygenase SsuD/methylene tetrahydromethanopterin reductase-like flavin-dependent oxidoreductase (luciferase family)